MILLLSRFYTIFDTTLISSVRLTHEEQKILENRIREVRAYTRSSFLEIRSQLQEERDLIADKVSTTDDDYNRIFDRAPEIARVDIKTKDINKMYELMEAIKAIDFILANSFSLESSTVDPFALAKSNANNPDIDIRTYFSGSLAKLNYGEDLQALAKRTLGDPDRWIDIAITNGLKAPYIDEVGQAIPLISNASGTQINIAGLDANNESIVDRLSIGQIILLQSNVQNFPEQRYIQSIRSVPVSDEIIIELSGEADLNKYKIVDDAHIRIFKPNTINSSFFIMIPSESTLDDDAEVETPWFLEGAGGTEKRQKVDLNIQDNGDLNLSPTGDLELSYGITNSVQAIRLKMSIEEGELRRHPDYGLVNVVGIKNDNITNIRRTLTDSITSMIGADERFSNIESLNVSYDSDSNGLSGTKVLVSLVVKLAGSGQLLPITFTVNK